MASNKARRIVRPTSRPRRKRQTFKEALLSMPNVGKDRDFARVRERVREARV